MGIVKKLLIGVSGLSLTGVGGAVAYRKTLIDQRLLELGADIRKAEDDKQAVLREIDAEKQRHAAQLKVLKEKKQIVENLWEDRFQRYMTSGVNLQGYVACLGEAIGIQRALINHYAHMTKVMNPFPRYDFSVSHIHNFEMLLTQAIKRGLHTALGMMSSLLSSEPLVKSVCETAARQHALLVRAETGESADDFLKRPSEFSARSLDELSKTFAYSVLELENAVATATEVRDACDKERPAFMATHNQQNGSGGIVVAGAQTVLNALKVNPEQETPIVTYIKKRAQVGTIKDEAQLKQMKRNDLDGVTVSDETADAFEVETVLLRDAADVKSAMDHVAAVSKSFSEPQNAWLIEKADTRKNITERRLMEACQRVVVALEQLRLWRKAAVCFLIEQQHLDALRAYDICLAHTMCYVDKSITPAQPRTQKPQQ